MASVEELKHLQIPFHDIASATNDFAKENYIGLGGFGKVYKGRSEKLGTIAIKRLDRDRGEHSQGDREFRTEIALLSIYKHENIVSLRGFCDEEGEMILVYQYESKGSLDKHLKSTDLTWTQRLKICLDAARGLKYLHHDIAPGHRAFHRDIKSANILLDENWKAKISDFGLSRKGPADVQASFVNSNACGTLGYVDPEYFSTGYLTQKSDVFSFGVVLFEVLCGRPAFVRIKGKFFFYWVQNHYIRKTLDEIIHSNLHEQINPASLSTFSSIAYKCLINGAERPSMEEVVEQLQKALDTQLASSGPRSNTYDFAAFHQKHSRAISSSSPTTSQPQKYDFYLSFCEDDTRMTFVDHLYSALTQQLEIYKDDKTLMRVDYVRPSLFKAMRDSKIAIVIFSKNYANSRWCLDELSLIMKFRDERGLIVIPVFYHMDPSDVRKQKVFGPPNINEVNSWTKALKDATNLTDAANLVGFTVERYDHEAKAIEQIVYTITHRLLSLMPCDEASAETRGRTDLIGIETRMQELRSLLEIESGGSRSNTYDDEDFAAFHQKRSREMPSSSQSSPTTSRPWKYDVYISFRGYDTRMSFVDHLYSALVQQLGIYKDDEDLMWGESIISQQIKAIEESKIAIVVLSENYANSRFCLDELAFIMKCRDERGLIVIPVFYHVERSEVQKQNMFGATNINEDNSWRKALVESANLTGFKVQRNDYEAKVIEQIVYTITHRLVIMPSEEASDETRARTDLIRKETRVQELRPLLEIESGGVRMVGICGIWGSGKSTLASCIYDEIRRSFQGCSFVKNVSAESRMQGLKTLQEKILSDVFRSKVTLKSTKQGVSMMRRRLCQKSVLIVLDDVNHVDHLKMLAGSLDWFGYGSRIIITTRNQDLVNAHNCVTHNVRMFDVEEAIALFSRHAFGAGRHVEAGYEELSRSLVSKLGGHPSALKSLGSFLHAKDMTEWTRTLTRLEGIPVHEILEKFNTGDDGVSRNIFSWFAT